MDFLSDVFWLNLYLSYEWFNSCKIDNEHYNIVVLLDLTFFYNVTKMVYRNARACMIIFNPIELDISSLASNWSAYQIAEHIRIISALQNLPIHVRNE